MHELTASATVTDCCLCCCLLPLQVKVQQVLDDVQYQVIARGDKARVAEDAAVLRDYFNLQACLKDLCQEWCSRDERYKSLHTYFPGRT